jgi:hypothetical protein
MLERAKATNAKFTVVSGGEESPGYCFNSLQDLQTRIQRRRDRLAATLRQFPNFRKGATIAPWDRPEHKKSWLLTGYCATSSAKKIDDFQPLIRELLNSYNYVWIYAASAAGYDPYDPAAVPVYNKMLSAAMNGERR